MKTREKFILDTLLPYKLDPQTCAMIGRSCVYLDHDGNKCAVGKHMKKSPLQRSEDTIMYLMQTMDEALIFRKPALDQKLNSYTWSLMQEYHDSIAVEKSGIEVNKSNLNDIVEALEKETSTNLEKLYYEEV